MNWLKTIINVAIVCIPFVSHFAVSQIERDPQDKSKCYQHKICFGDKFPIMDIGIEVLNSNLEGSIDENLNLKIARSLGIYFNIKEFNQPDPKDYERLERNLKISFFYLTKTSGFDYARLIEEYNSSEPGPAWYEFDLIWSGKLKKIYRSFQEERWTFTLPFETRLNDIYYGFQEGVMLLKFEGFLDLPPFYVFFKTKPDNSKTSIASHVPRIQVKNFSKVITALKNKQKKITVPTVESFSREYVQFWRDLFGIKNVFTSAEDLDFAIHKTSNQDSVETLKQEFKSQYSLPQKSFYQKFCEAFYPKEENELKFQVCYNNADSVIDISRFYYVHKTFRRQKESMVDLRFPSTIIGFENGKKSEGHDKKSKIYQEYFLANGSVLGSTSVVEKLLKGSGLFSSVVNGGIGGGVSIASTHTIENANAQYWNFNVKQDVAFNIATIPTHFDGLVTSCFSVRSIPYIREGTSTGYGLTSTIFLKAKKIYFFCLEENGLYAGNKEYISFNENYYFLREGRNNIYQSIPGTNSHSQIGFVIDFRGKVNLDQYMDYVQSSKKTIVYYDAIKKFNEILGLEFFPGHNLSGEEKPIINQFYKFRNYPKVIKGF